MKRKLLKLLIIILPISVFLGSCDKDEIEYADEKVVVNNIPGIAIYKTKSNYYDKIAVCQDSSGNVTCYPSYSYESDNIQIKEDKVILKNRYLLKSGYIVEPIFIDYAFTNITIKEMVDKTKEFGSNYWLLNKFENRIIDNDPFSEFYFLGVQDGPEKEFSLGEINEMFKNGTIEQIFSKLK